MCVNKYGVCIWCVCVCLSVCVSIYLSVCLCDMEVSVDVGHWEEGLRACHRLLELDCAQAVGVDVLQVLVGVVTQGMPEKNIPPGEQACLYTCESVL